ARCGEPDDGTRCEGSRVPDRLRREPRARHRRRATARPHRRGPGRCARGVARQPSRIGAGADGEPAVSIADYQSEADEDAQARDREETKRLLYVALTRARDRLYLSAMLKDGVCRPGRGSLADVLPPSLTALLPRASSQATLTWT